MPDKIFKERFCEIKKIKICTTTAELNFDNYTEPGTYEIYEDMGSGRNRIYFLTVDKSVSGACIKQTRIHCGTVDARQSTTAGTWTAWTAVTGGGSSGGDIDLSEYVKWEDFEQRTTPIENNVADIIETIGDIDTALDELHTYAQALVGGDA